MDHPLGQIARIFAMQGRYGEAETRYDEALSAVQRAGDLESEAVTLQNWGILAIERRQYGRAAKLCGRALQLFQEMHSEGRVMESCNLLGRVEQYTNRLAEARAWYERSWEIAKRRPDQRGIGTTAQNLGIVCQLEGEAARKRGDEARAREHLTEALGWVGESLAIRVEDQNELGMADSHGQLAQIHRLLGDLDKAEEHAHHARDIHDRFGDKETWKDYATLAAIARDRNQPTEAAAWEQKRDALLAELQCRAGAPS